MLQVVIELRRISRGAFGNHKETLTYKAAWELFVTCMRGAVRQPVSVAVPHMPHVVPFSANVPALSPGPDRNLP
jgi:hypothetical protein